MKLKTLKVIVLKHKKEVAELITDYRKQGKSIGFVPTMGALHEGHLSLMRKCKRDNAIAVASIFVNPTQFNDKNDLKNYPRTFDADAAKFESEGCDVIFAPEVDEMYPEPDSRVFELGMLDKVMEGAHRPGHFNGVCQVVTKLFDIVMPDKAYFGEKDFQQLAVIKYIVKQFNYPIQIIPCPIIREPDGLAMSSRNMLLEPVIRKNAPLISTTLFKAVELKNNLDVKELKKWVINSVDSNEYLKTEYFDIVDDSTLLSVDNWNSSSGLIGCIAVKAGAIRLIDNIRFI